MVSNPPLTREGLIWKVALTIAAAEGKTDTKDRIIADRNYILDLLEKVAAIIDKGPLMIAHAGK